MTCKRYTEILNVRCCPHAESIYKLDDPSFQARICKELSTKDTLHRCDPNPANDGGFPDYCKLVKIEVKKK